MNQLSLDRTVLVDLAQLSLLRASGPDAQNFLNGQLTNDLGALDDTRSQLSAWCSPKGRMLALFRVFRHDGAYLLQLPTSLRDEILKRLRVYILRSKVTLDSADDAYARIGVAGPRADEIVRAAAGAAPERVDECATRRDVVVARLPGASPRLEILARPSEAPRLRDRLAAHAVAGDSDAWTLHDVMAGIPTVLPETSDAFIPQMANLDLIGGISFNKGCYTGQEIVARVHHLGRLKQRMYRAHVETSDPPAPGAAIYSPDGRGQATGTVVIACPAPASGCELLAVIHTASVAAGELRLGGPNGPRLVIERLPYSV